MMIDISNCMLHHNLFDFLTAKDQRKCHQTHYLWIINVEQCQAIPKTTYIVGTGN